VLETHAEARRLLISAPRINLIAAHSAAPRLDQLAIEPSKCREAAADRMVCAVRNLAESEVVRSVFDPPSTW
jgi:hypothetical protein